MTWWIDARDGYIHLMDDDTLIANFLSQEAADEVLGMHDLIMHQGKLLTGVVNTIRGTPPELKLWSHSDAPELAAQMMEKLHACETFAGLVAGVLPVCLGNAELIVKRLEAMRLRLQSGWTDEA